MIIPCRTLTNCPCEEIPLANISAEAPDRRMHYRRDYNMRVPNHAAYRAQGCISLCESQVSQEEADLCAAAQAASCETIPVTNYQNTAQTFSRACTDGTTATFTTPAGMFTRSTQAEADLAALQYAMSRVEIECGDTSGGGGGTGGGVTGGPSTTRYFNTAQSCTETCGRGGGTSTATVPAGRFVGLTQAEADMAARTYACRQAQLTMMCLGDLPRDAACVDVEYSETIGVIGGDPLFWSISAGSLPPGLTLFENPLDPSGADLEGTPTTGGLYDFEITVRDGAGNTAKRLYTMRIVEITTAESLPQATAGQAYSQTLIQTGGLAPVNWQIDSCTTEPAPCGLPPGLSINQETGEISGTPGGEATPGGNPTTWTFTVVLQDEAT